MEAEPDDPISGDNYGPHLAVMDFDDDVSIRRSAFIATPRKSILVDAANEVQNRWNEKFTTDAPPIEVIMGALEWQWRHMIFKDKHEPRHWSTMETFRTVNDSEDPDPDSGGFAEWSANNTTSLDAETISATTSQIMDELSEITQSL